MKSNLGRWFRFYANALNDPKVQRLDGEMFKAWVNILCLASLSQGIVPPVDEIAFQLRISQDAAQRIVDHLLKVGLLEPIAMDCYEPHNWTKRQYISDPTAAERMQRYRERKRNATVTTVTSTVTLPPVEADTDTEAERVVASQPVDANARRHDDWPDNFFEVFWHRWPNKDAKRKAELSLRSIHKADRISFREIIDGVDRYVRDKPSDRPWMLPTTFLNGERWNDELTPVRSAHDDPKRNPVAAARKLFGASEGNAGDHQPGHQSNLLRLPGR